MASPVIQAGFTGLLLAACAAVCLGQTDPANSDYSAKVLSSSGQVSVLRDSQPWALSSGDTIQMKQEIVTGPDGSAVFQVSDGSTFEVFPNSTVVFRKNATNWRDLLDVAIGRVKVHIQRWGGQPNFNRVHTPTAVISVRGTIFDVSVDEEELTTTVSVEEGAVDVRHALKGGEPKRVNAGESIQVFKNEPLAAVGIDKLEVARGVIRGIYDALYTAVTRTPSRVGGIPGGGGTGGGTGSGQTPPPPPPTNLPPPPPPPPPAN